MKKPGKLLALCAFAMLCGNLVTDTVSAQSSAAAKVLIKDFMFEPMSLKVHAGTKVTWVNTDDEPHTVVSDEGLFRSGGMDTNESFSFTFEKPGTYHLTCSIHPRMVATVIVE